MWVSKLLVSHSSINPATNSSAPSSQSQNEFQWRVSLEFIALFICRQLEILFNIDGVVADVHVKLVAEVTQVRVQIFFGSLAPFGDVEDLNQDDPDVHLVPWNALQYLES